jgi:catechol 2,3-dioxygenase
MEIDVSVPRPADLAPFNVTRASHIVLTVRDLARSRAFYVDMMGLVVSDANPETLYLRGLEEACHHSVVLRKSDTEPACERIGMRVRSNDDLEKAKAYFDRMGLPAQWVEVPYQSKTLHISDNMGTPIELCANMDVVPRMIVQFQHFTGPCPLRLDHFQLLSPNVQSSCQFYADLGFRPSEYIAQDDRDELLFVFLQRKGNPHDIVFANGIGPQLHHFAFTVPEAYHIIHGCDVAASHGFGSNLEYGPGRHGPGHALFDYFRDPDGHRMEIFNAHYQMIDSELEPVRWSASSLRDRAWGLPPRRRWFDQATHFVGATLRAPSVATPPMSLETLVVSGTF